MPGMGLQGAYGVQGAQQSLDELLARRKDQEAIKRQIEQQQFENTMREREHAEDVRMREQQMNVQNEDRQYNRAGQVVDDLVPNQSIDPQTTGMLRSGGRGALVSENPLPAGHQFLEMQPDYVPGAQPGFVFTGTGQQRQAIASNERLLRQAESQAAEQARRDTETNRHNVAMENKPSAMSTVVVQGPEGPMFADKRTGTARPIADPAGKNLGFAPTQQQRNTKAQYTKARPILTAIGDLSEKINTTQGTLAKIRGAEARAAAEINLNDDVAEYEAMISGFTPLIARALGHTGVLTEQDVRSVKALFPRPGDSKSLRDRKVARIEQLMGAIEAGGTTPDATDDASSEFDFVPGKGLVPRGQ